jgi:hypothetical protein
VVAAAEATDARTLAVASNWLDAAAYGSFGGGNRCWDAPVERSAMTAFRRILDWSMRRWSLTSRRWAISLTKRSSNPPS